MSYWEQIKTRRLPGHPVVKAFAEPIVNYMLSFMDLNEDSKILDVGCGNGFFTYYFSRIAKTVGVDSSKNMLSMNPCENLICADASCLPFPNDEYDLVFCASLLHHVDNPLNVIKEMKRTSKKYVIFLEPNRNNPLMFLFFAIKREERKAIKFSISYLEKLTKEAGLDIIKRCSLGSIVPNKTPVFLLPILKRLHTFPFALGYNNLIITRIPQ